MAPASPAPPAPAAPATRPGRWRLVVALAAYVLWAPAAFVALAFGGLLLASRPRAARPWVLAGLALGLGVGWLLLPGSYALDQLLRAWALVGTAAFVLAARELPGPFLRRATVAVVAASLAVVVLAGHAHLGWGRLHWEATRSAAFGLSLVAARNAALYDALEPATRFASDAFPATFALQAIAGWALAWQWHCRVAERPLGPPLGRLREFTFSDHWVWGVVAGLAFLVLKSATALKMLALNLLAVLAAFYFLRGLGVLVAFAGAMGVSSGALVIAGVVAGVLVIPLLVLIPALWTIGVGDTWFQFRRRLSAAA